jgi:hypothetical protein
LQRFLQVLDLGAGQGAAQCRHASRHLGGNPVKSAHFWVFPRKGEPA